MKDSISIPGQLDSAGIDPRRFEEEILGYDVLIKNGTLIDGTGNPRRSGNVAISDGQIVAVGDIDGLATRVIDADGAIVAPGFIDPHTHYDAQICWDGAVTPSQQICAS